MLMPLLLLFIHIIFKQEGFLLPILDLQLS